MKTMVSFKVSTYELNLLEKVMARACSVDSSLDRLHTLMDLTACHANGCPLKLADMLNADQFDLMHDVYGIARHIDRKTGQLTNCFLPRFAL